MSSLISFITAWEFCVSLHWMVKLGSKKFCHGLNYISTNFTTLSEIKRHDHTHQSLCLGFPILDCDTKIYKMLYPKVKYFHINMEKNDQEGRYIFSHYLLYHFRILILFLFFFSFFKVFQMKFHFQMFAIVFSKPHYMLILDHNCTDS